MSDTEPNAADRARAARIDELDIERRRTEFDIHRYVQSAAHHHERWSALQATLRDKRARLAVLDEELHHLRYPATGVDLGSVREVLEDKAHRALQGGAR